MLAEADLDNDAEITYDEFLLYIKGGAAKGDHVEAALQVIDTEIGKSPSRFKHARLPSISSMSSLPSTPHGYRKLSEPLSEALILGSSAKCESDAGAGS